MKTKLEEAAKNWITKNSGIKSLLTPEFVRESFRAGAKWQAERMISKEAYEDSLNMQKASNAGYESKIAELNQQIEKMHSEKEVLKIIQECKSYLSFEDEFNEIEWFEQFKK